MITIAKPFLPPNWECIAIFSGIWKSNWITIIGPLKSELETKLKVHLGPKHLLFVGSSTVAMQLTIKAAL